MRMISFKDGDLSSQFDNIKENDVPILSKIATLPTQIQSTPHQQMLKNNHTNVNKG